VLYELAVALVGVVAGGVATIAGFGVGSLLTPFLSSAYGAKLAVAIVALPHAIATAIRLWWLRREINRQVFLRFGLTSAVGGLVGGFLFTQVENRALARTLGALLIVVGVAELIGLAQRFLLSKRYAWAAGAVSGLFGGMVGNQGGIRSAGLLAFDLNPREFVATAAAIALLVDAVRVPIYAWADGAALMGATRMIVVATVGVVIGTFVGSRVLLRLPQTLFRRTIGAVLLGLGVWMLT
jgi:uncharacterized membrane protein YfcA